MLSPANFPWGGVAIVVHTNVLRQRALQDWGTAEIMAQRHRCGRGDGIVWQL